MTLCHPDGGCPSQARRCILRDMSSVTRIAVNPDIVHLLVMRKALDGQRTGAEALLGVLPPPVAAPRPGTPPVASVTSGLDVYV